MSFARPEVSVIIPTYKRAHLVERAIRSVLRQTFKSFEILVVDDGSADNTKSVVEAIGDERIRYIRHDVNKGLPATRNTGIAAAKGSFIAFLDDDDQWKETKLQRQLEVIREYDAVLCGYISTRNRRNPRYSRTVVDSEVLRRGNIFAPSGLLARASVFDELRFDTELPRGVGEDWDMYIRMSQKYRIGYLGEPLLVYEDSAQTGRITTEQSNMTISELEKRMKVLNKHKEFFGTYWFDYHVARFLLSYMRYRVGKLKHIAYVVKRCGILPVTAVFVNKLAGYK